MYKFNPRLIFYKDIHSYYDKEKVNEVINKIENNEKNVILIGKKNSGKSKVLKEFNEQNKENNIGSFLINDSFIIENMEKEEIISRIELLIYKKFYNMLSEKSKGKLNWLNINIDSEFKKLDQLRMINADKYDHFKIGSITEKVLNLMKKENIKTYFILDRNDILDNKTLTGVLKTYKKIFDKSIISIEETKENKEYLENLKLFDYNIINLNYTDNYNFIRNYVNKTIKKPVKKITKSFDIEEEIGKENLEKIVKTSNGDMDIIKKRFINLFTEAKKEEVLLNQLSDERIKEIISYKEEIKKIKIKNRI